jgi:hypothetical protein
LDQFSGGEELLANMVSDPRQRLAKVMKQPRRAKVPVSIDTMDESGVEAYIPTRYMEVDPANVCPPPEEKPYSLQNGEQPEQLPTQYYDDAVPTPVARNGEGRGEFRTRSGPVYEQSLDTSYSLDAMERGNDEEDYYLEPSPLTADTGEGYLNSFSNGFALDEMSREAFERNPRLLLDAPDGRREQDLDGNYGTRDGVGAHLRGEGERARAVGAEILVEMPSSNLMGWNDDTCDLDEQDPQAQDMDDLSAELFHHTRTVPNGTGAWREGRESPNTQEMDDLSAELFQKNHGARENVLADGSTSIHDPSKIDQKRFRMLPQRYPSQSTLNSSLPSQQYEEERVEETASNLLAQEQFSTSSQQPRNPRQGQATAAKVPHGGAQSGSMQPGSRSSPEAASRPLLYPSVASLQSQGHDAHPAVDGFTSGGSKSSPHLASSRQSPEEALHDLQPETDRSLASRDQSEAFDSLNNDEFLRTQRAMVTKLNSERERAQQEAEAAQRELGRRSQEYRRDLQRREQEATVLQEKVGKAESDHDDKFLRAQQAMVSKLHLERERAQQEAEAAQRDLERQSQEYRRELQRREQEFVDLQEKVGKTESDHDDKFLGAQQAMVSKLNLERERAQQEAEAAQRDLERQSQEYRRELQRREHELVHLHD